MSATPLDVDAWVRACVTNAEKEGASAFAILAALVETLAYEYSHDSRRIIVTKWFADTVAAARKQSIDPQTIKHILLKNAYRMLVTLILELDHPAANKTYKVMRYLSAQ